MGAALMHLGRHEDAVPPLQRALDLKPGNSNAWIDLISSLIALKHYDEALVISETALIWHAHQAWVVNAVGRVYLDLKRYDEALESFAHAMRLLLMTLADTEAIRAYIMWDNIAEAYIGLKNPDAALEALDRAASLNPSNTRTWFLRGMALSHLIRYDEALVAYEHVLALDAKHASAWNNKAISLLHLGRLAEAMQAVDHSLELHPNHSHAINTKGCIFAYLGHGREALPLFQETVGLDPKLALGWFNIGVVLSTQGQREDAMQHLEWACELAPEDARAHAHLGMFHTRQKDFDTALRELNKAVALDTKCSIAWLGMAIFLHAVGDDDKAMQTLEHAFKLGPEYRYAIYTRHLQAQILRALGRDDEARIVEQRAEQFAAEQWALIDRAAQIPQAPVKRTKWDESSDIY
jgi:tetratricopeptide (TPR) repeat protein